MRFSRRCALPFASHGENLSRYVVGRSLPGRFDRGGPGDQVLSERNFIAFPAAASDCTTAGIRAPRRSGEILPHGFDHEGAPGPAVAEHGQGTVHGIQQRIRCVPVKHKSVPGGGCRIVILDRIGQSPVLWTMGTLPYFSAISCPSPQGSYREGIRNKSVPA